VAALDPDNRLATTPVTEGYILLAENAESAATAAAWEMRFEEGFHLPSILEVEHDVPGGDPNALGRMPGMRRALVLREDANGWSTELWSYEASGTVESALAFYRNELLIAGFDQRGVRLASDSGGGLLRMERDAYGYVVHAVRVADGARPLQVTLQKYRR
jgi:hypothetical protein